MYDRQMSRPPADSVFDVVLRQIPEVRVCGHLEGPPGEEPPPVFLWYDHRGGFKMRVRPADGAGMTRDTLAAIRRSLDGEGPQP